MPLALIAAVPLGRGRERPGAAAMTLLGTARRFPFPPQRQALRHGMLTLQHGYTVVARATRRTGTVAPGRNSRGILAGKRFPQGHRIWPAPQHHSLPALRLVPYSPISPCLTSMVIRSTLPPHETVSARCSWFTAARPGDPSARRNSLSCNHNSPPSKPMASPPSP